MVRKVAIGIWVAAIVCGIAAYFLWPDSFSPSSLAAFFQKHQDAALLVYLLVSIARGFTLLPSTPLVLAGTIIYPDSPFTILAISIFGIVVSSSLIYWFSDLLGFDKYFSSKKPDRLGMIRQRLEHPLGLGFVAAWAFFPLVPTDAVCYVAGTIRMHFGKFIAAVFAGELILCSLYVFGGGRLVGLFAL